MFSFKIHTENKAVRPVSELFCFLKKALNEVLASSQHLSFNILVVISKWSAPYFQYILVVLDLDIQ